jgi:hypothetical protein
VIIVGSSGKAPQLLTTLESEGYSVNSTINDPENQGKIPGNGSKNDRFLLNAIFSTFFRYIG